LRQQIAVLAVLTGKQLTNEAKAMYGKIKSHISSVKRQVIFRKYVK